MLFNSIQFAIYFIITVSAFYLTPFKWRWLLLLLASCYFYMVYIPIYILILALTITIDYFVGLGLENTQGRVKRSLLIISIISNIGILCFFKYYNFFADNITSLISLTGYKAHIPLSTLILPIGLSFHTFQALSYIVEVYRGNQKAERHFGIYALYVMFFPQLVAGPIERPQNIIYQFYKKIEFDPENISEGLKLMLSGFFKKLVVADRLAIYVNTFYGHPTEANGKTLALSTLFFAIQIYCDFSGYSDIAIGAARVMGFKLMTNFNRPYLARNVSEFWSRWHISLTSWFRDYVYIPMGGNRGTAITVSFNLLLVFALSGLWHGANWTFMIWGLINGLFLVLLRASRKFWPAFYRLTYLNKAAWLKIPLQIIVTGICVCTSWIFFRAASVKDAVYIFKTILHFNGEVERFQYNLSYCLLAITLLAIWEIKQEYFGRVFQISNHPNYLIRNLYYATVVLTIFLLGVFDGGQFIYFQF